MITSKKKRKRSGILDKKQEWDDCKKWFGYRCAYCNRPVDLTKDHVRPRKFGGTDLVFNIIPACQKCNSSKGKKDIWKWFRSNPIYHPASESRIRQYLYTKYYEEESRRRK